MRDGKYRPPTAAGFDIADDDLLRFVASRLTEQPADTYRQRLNLSGDCPVGTYVIATDRAVQPYRSTFERLRRRGWKIIEMSGGHELMLTRPESIAQVLHDAGSQQDLGNQRH